MSVKSIITVPKPDHFSFTEILWFLDRKYDDCLYELYPGEVRRLVTSSQGTGIISIRENGAQLILEILSGDLDAYYLEGYVVKWFDLERDIAPFYQLLSQSSLHHMVSEYQGLRMVGIPDLFEAICWCIIGQQINLNFAYKIKRRFVETYGKSIVHEGTKYLAFPTPEALEGVGMDDLKALQFSKQKADYILVLAENFREGSISEEALRPLSHEDQQKALLQLRGVGEWTANYVLMKTFGDTGSVPYGDVGLYKALENFGVISDRKDDKSIHTFFDQFPGWGSYLTIYLWRSLTSPEIK